MRVAIYARVSKEDMHADNQLIQLRTWVSNAGHTLTAEYVDRVSGAKSAEHRAQLAAMLDAAHQRQFDIVVFWALDRFSREGMGPTIQYLQRLHAAGVSFHSYTEPALCSDNELTRDILLAVLAALAKAERVRISERTKLGIERVRRRGSKSGKPIGHPTVKTSVQLRIRQIAAEHPDYGTYLIAREVGCDPKTVRKYL